MGEEIGEPYRPHEKLIGSGTFSWQEAVLLLVFRALFFDSPITALRSVLSDP